MVIRPPARSEITPDISVATRSEGFFKIELLSSVGPSALCEEWSCFQRLCLPKWTV